jgi:2-dehydropantoate 2-reductase
MGTGGLGGYYGGIIAKAGFDVNFIARGENLKAMRQSGLKVVSVQGEFLVQVKATSEPSQVGPVDLVLFCVKSYDTEVAAHSALPLVAEGGSVLTIQNGIDNQEKIRAIVGDVNVLPGAAFIASEVASPGVIRQSAGPRNIVFGEVSGKRTERAEQILEILSSAGITCELSDNIRKVLWEKFIWICGMAGANCLTRLPMGEIVRSPETREMFRVIMGEVTKVAQTIGIPIQDNYVNQQMDFADRLEKKATSSMFRDLLAGKKLELQALHGTVVRLGNEYGVPTPANKMVYATLKPYESGRPGLLAS